jgi:hypothetical protein
MAKEIGDWTVKNQVHVRALRILITFAFLLAIVSFGYLFFDQSDEIPTFVFIGFISSAIIFQIFFLKPSVITIIRSGDHLNIISKSLFNPKSKTEINIPINDIIEFKVVKTRSIIGGKLLIKYNIGDHRETITLFLKNFTLSRRMQLLDNLSNTIK